MLTVDQAPAWAGQEQEEVSTLDGFVDAAVVADQLVLHSQLLEQLVGWVQQGLDGFAVAPRSPWNEGYYSGIMEVFNELKAAGVVFEQREIEIGWDIQCWLDELEEHGEEEGIA